MNAEELNRLIDKYYNGLCTDEEEKILRVFFREGNIPEGYETEKLIFSYYTTSAEVPEPSIGFEDRILEGIGASEGTAGSGKFRKYILPYLSIAAGLLIMTGSYFFFMNRSQYSDTFSDPEIAYDEAMKILMNVSVKLNRGTLALSPVSKMNEVTAKTFESFNKSTNLIGKNLESLDYIQKANNIYNKPLTNDK
jgi:hypothetical protein